MIALYDNQTWKTVSSLIGYSSQDNNYKWQTALYDTRLSRYGRTTGCTAEWLKFSYASSIDITYVTILAHNLTKNATVTIQGNSSDSWTSPAFSETILIDNSLTDLTPTMKYAWAIKKLSIKRTYQYFRITFADSGNTDGFIQIGYIYLGTELIYPSFNIESPIPRKSNAIVNESMSGQSFGQKKIKWKEPDHIFESVSRTYKNNLDSFFDIVDIVTPFILCVWENSLSLEPPVYCRLTEGFSWCPDDSHGDLWKFEQKCKEVF